MRIKIKKNRLFTYIRLILGFLVLLLLLFKSTVLHKLTQLTHHQPPEKQTKSLSSAHINNGDQSNDYLYVDCTGFFE
jgi:hypothetical protein